MADAYHLNAGQTLTVTVNEGRAHVLTIDGTKGGFTRSSVVYGPFLVGTDWLVDGDVSVAIADYTAAHNAYIYPNAGAPDDAAQAALTVNPTGDDNGLIFTARAYGTEGNSISVEYVDPGADAALSVSVFRQAITVNLAYAEEAITSTAAEVLAAIEAHSEANQLVTVAIQTADSGSGDDGSGIVTAMAAASLTGGAGTGIGIVSKGALVVDTTNGALYQNTGTQAVPAYSTSLTVSNGIPATVDIALAAGAANVMQITITVQDSNGDAIASVFELDWWISDAATGIGLTADSFSGDVATTTGTEFVEHTSKKHYTGLTDVNGVIVATVTDTNTPADIYVAVRHPLTGEVNVSAASGTSWGA